MGPPANLQLEPGRCSREPLVDYQHWTKMCCCRLGSQSPCHGAQGSGLLRLPLPHETRRLSMGICFRRYYFPVQAATDGLYGSQCQRLFLLLLLALKRLDIFFPARSTGLHSTSTPPFQPPRKGRCIASGSRMYSHLLLFSLRSLTYYALTLPDAQAPTATVYTPTTAVHTYAAVHAPPAVRSW